MSRSCPGNATATLLAALTFFVKNKLILLYFDKILILSVFTRDFNKIARLHGIDF